MLNFDKLKDLDLEQLRTLAVQQGMTPHHKTKEKTLIKQIIEHVTAPPKQGTDMVHPAAKPNTDAVLHSEEQILEAIKPFLAKPGFSAMFREDQVWHFKCNGAEDVGHMSVPLRVIKMKAETVSRGARKPAMVGISMVDGKPVLAA